MSNVEQLKQKLAEAQKVEEVKKQKQHEVTIHNAVNAYQALKYREDDFQNAKRRLDQLLQFLDDEQFKEYAVLTTEWDKKSDLKEMERLSFRESQIPQVKK